MVPFEERHVKNKIQIVIAFIEHLGFLTFESIHYNNVKFIKSNDIWENIIKQNRFFDMLKLSRLLKKNIINKNFNFFYYFVL